MLDWLDWLCDWQNDWINIDGLSWRLDLTQEWLMLDWLDWLSDRQIEQISDWTNIARLSSRLDLTAEWLIQDRCLLLDGWVNSGKLFRRLLRDWSNECVLQDLMSTWALLPWWQYSQVTFDEIQVPISLTSNYGIELIHPHRFHWSLILLKSY